LTRNKNLYKDFLKQDVFSDRLIFFLFHFAFFLKTFKNEDNKKVLQNIYDHCFKQLELSIREIGYGDVTINKKMKTYINTFYLILNKVDKWNSFQIKEKRFILESFLKINISSDFLPNYFDNYSLELSNNTLNYYLKGVIND